MKIGDVASATGVPPRMIRYYEAQGLLEPGRSANGYRDYSDADVGRIRRIRNHIVAGFPTRLIKIVLDMEKPTWAASCDAEFVRMVREELEGVEERISCLRASRDTLRSYLAQAESS